uniref:Uncharacterized protein n=1 Tax=Corethron hystrix TaxID=216773 RepID=A0A7S1BIV2_9STRA|mmetsp:Transcript_29893/g.68590  ORF Transcript_29893/g.68590 Transcript_29893/m.68590 type:complete len:118 (+) Transcript_29893:90-443(+)
MIRKFAAYISFVGFISLYLPETLALHGPSSPKGGNNGRDRTMMYLATPLVAKKLIHDVRSKGQDNIGARIGVKGRMGSRDMLAMAIPGYGTGEQIFVGGMANFFSAFNAGKLISGCV